MSVNWDYRFSVSVPALDRQHIKLFDVFNDLLAGLNSVHKQEACEVALDELLSYAQKHFAAEEAALQKAGYPGLREQVEQHTKFMAMLENLRGKIRTDPDTVGAQMVKFLSDWFGNHIKEFDTLYTPYLKRK